MRFALAACALLSLAGSVAADDPALVAWLHSVPELSGWRWSQHPTIMPSGFRPGPGDTVLLHQTLSKNGFRFEMLATRFSSPARIDDAIAFMAKTSQQWSPPIDCSKTIPKVPKGLFFRKGTVLCEMYIIPPLVRGRPDTHAQPAMPATQFRSLVRKTLERL